MTLLRRAFAAAALYLAVLTPLCGLRPLWLDEILQLQDTRLASPTAMLEHVRKVPGAAPLGYLTQQLALKATGYSVRRARLPSAVFAGGALFVTILLAAELAMPPMWAACIFGLLPLTVRYATESRAYSQALFFSVLATLLYIRLTNKPGAKRAAGYSLALLAAAFTQPYAASVGIAHLLWSLNCRNRRAAAVGGIALAATVLAYLPWQFEPGTHPVAAMGYAAPHFSASLKTPLMLFRELAGGGYWVSGLLLVLGSATLRKGALTNRSAALLKLLILTPLLSVIASDALFGYFLAARQFIWILPALAILASGATRVKPLGLLLLAALAPLSAWQSMRYLNNSAENWQAASDQLYRATRAGACLSVSPPEHQALYEYFHAGLAQKPCNGVTWIVAVSPYATCARRARTLTDLESKGYRCESETVVGGTRIVALTRVVPRDRRGLDQK